MSLLGERARAIVRDEFQKLEKPVKLIHFTQGLMCDTCPETQQLLEDVASLTGRKGISVPPKVIQ